MLTPRHAASLAVLTSAALLAPAGAALASDASLDTTERWMLGQVNLERAAAGVAPLEASTTLGRAADGYASYLAAHPSVAASHEADGRTVGQRLDAAGWPDASGYAEDVFTSRTEGAQDALDAWLASPAHRANLLDGNLRSVGVARSGRSWVLDFGRACSDARCEMTGDRGDATLTVGTSGTTSAPAASSGTATTTSTAATPAPAPTSSTATPTAATSATAPAGAAGASAATAASSAAALRVSSVRARGQVISVTVAVAKERRRAVRVTASRAGRTVALRLATTRALAGGRVARTYARKLPTGTWKIHAQLRRTAVA